MMYLILIFTAILGLASSTTHQQQRLLAATEVVALTALEYRARGASTDLAASGGVVAGLIAYKLHPHPPLKPNKPPPNNHYATRAIHRRHP